MIQVASTFTSLFMLTILVIFLKFFFYKIFVLGITMQLDISAKLTPQVTTNICHHMKKKYY